MGFIRYLALQSGNISWKYIQRESVSELLGVLGSNFRYHVIKSMSGAPVLYNKPASLSFNGRWLLNVYHCDMTIRREPNMN